MGQHTQIVWLRISNDSHRLGRIGLDGMAAAVLGREAEVELGSRGH